MARRVCLAGSGIRSPRVVHPRAKLQHLYNVVHTRASESSLRAIRRAASRLGMHCRGYPTRNEGFVSQRIYVGNLPFSASEEEVERLFAAHGEVMSVALPTDRETGRPRGFGFVEMSPADAATAIEALNGTDLGGRALTVSEARAREQR